VDQQVGRRQVELPPDASLLAARVGEPARLLPHPRAGECERRRDQRFDDRSEIVHDLLGIDVHVAEQEILGAHLAHHALAIAIEGQPGQPAKRLREAAGQPRYRAVVDDAEAPVGQHPEVAGVRVAVQQPGPGRRRVVQQGEQGAGVIALGGGAVGDDPRERFALEPLGDDDLGRAGDDAGDGDVRIVGEGGGERALRVGLEGIVEFLEYPLLELGQQRLDL